MDGSSTVRNPGSLLPGSSVELAITPPSVPQNRDPSGASLVSGWCLGEARESFGPFPWLSFPANRGKNKVDPTRLELVTSAMRGRFEGFTVVRRRSKKGLNTPIWQSFHRVCSPLFASVVVKQSSTDVSGQLLEAFHINGAVVVHLTRVLVREGASV
jgi:hypothetical protein